MLLSLAASIVMFVITPPFKTFKEKETVSIKTNSNFSFTIRMKSKLKSTLVSIKKTAIQCAFTVPCWLVMATCAIFYMGIEPWVMGAKNSNEKYHHELDTSLSATLATMLSIVPIFGSPLMGIIIDRYQNNAIFCFAGGCLSAFGHFLLILGGQGLIPQVIEDGVSKTPFSVLLIANIILGVGYCMVASSIWTLLSYTVTSQDANIAYGMIQSMQHVGFIFASEVSAALIREVPGEAEKEYYRVVLKE
jgi:MFS family permease